MRRCPYCAEDITDDATRCPHCGSDVTVAPPASTPAPASDPTVLAPAPAGGTPAPDAAAWSSPQGTQGGWGAPQASGPASAGSVQFSHTGQRYLLGYDSTHFGIWDRSSPGAPVEQFPRSDDGWSQAWRRYVSLEPAGQPVQAAGAQGAYGASPGPYGGTTPQATAPWQQPAQGPYHSAYQARPAGGTNGMAIASLVLGLVGLVTFWFVAIPNILALVFGFIGRNQIKNTGGTQQGDGMAITGIVLGIVGAVIFVIFLFANIDRNNF